MFDDPKEELRRLAERLLEEEEPESPGDWLEDAHRLLGDDPYEEEEEEPDWQEPAVRNFANGYGWGRPVYSDVPEEYSDEPREKGVRGLVILACLELLGIGALVAYWLLVLL